MRRYWMTAWVHFNLGAILMVFIARVMPQVVFDVATIVMVGSIIAAIVLQFMGNRQQNGDEVTGCP